MKILNINDKDIRFIVKTMKRKTIGIRILSTGIVEVRCPKGINNKYIEELLKRKSQWILKNIEEINVIEDINQIYFLGTYCKVNKVRGEKNFINVENSMISIQYNGKISIEELFINYCREILRDILIKALDTYKEIMGIDFNKVTIKNINTRWGSCSSKGNLNFNVKLIGAPLDVIEYVVIHELCHLIHMNHSKEFWVEVSKYCSDYKDRSNWLKVNGHKIMNMLSNI
ncbi:M48 family metallopeptidase [Clostridium sp.]|uniref:M48 family metallopeptidase n=1 Tax=Clostridium sp. TaxID=1506 RepID=UPI003464E65B